VTPAPRSLSAAAPNAAATGAPGSPDQRQNGWFPRVLLVNLLLTAIMNGMRPIVSYRALALDADPAAIGLIAASFGILSLIIAVPAGRWIDRLGESKFLVAGTATVAIVAVMLAMSGSILALIISMMALGAGQITAAVSLQALIVNGGSAAGRDGRFGAQTVVASLGQLIGPAAAGLLVSQAMRSNQVAGGMVPIRATDGVFWIGALSGLAACAVALTLWRWPPRQHAHDGRPSRALEPLETTRTAVGRLLRVPSMPQAMLASVAILSSVDILVAYLPVYGAANGIPVETVGLLLAIRGAASMTSRSLMMPLRRLLGRGRLLVGSMLLPAIAFLIVPVVGPEMLPLFGAMAIIGFGLGVGQPLTMSWVAMRAPSEIRATAIGVRLSANRFGQFALPAAVGLMVGAAGVSAIFLSLGTLLTVSAALVTRARFDETTPSD
jgi:MFS family permease